jgi:hypothetical protein
MKKSLMFVSTVLFAVGGATGATTNDSLFVQSGADSISIWDMHAWENCASRFISSLSLSHDTLTWIQTDTVGPIARCLCTYDLVVSMVGLAPGSYVAQVYRDRRKLYHYSIDSLEYIGSTTFSVTAASGQFTARAFTQSECLGTATVQDDVVLTPAVMGLQNYPNPFNPTTKIGFRVWGLGSRVRLAVYDVLGREVAVLVNEYKNPGMYAVTFDGRGLSSGVYICRMTAGDFVESRKMVMMK